MKCDRRQYRQTLEVRRATAPGSACMASYDGCWAFAGGQLDEGRAIMEAWQLRVEQEHAYSARLVIDTGDERST